MKNLQMTKMSGKGKIFLLLGAFVVGFVVFGALALTTLKSVKVLGPHYDRIVLNKDLLADVLPPPNYIVETYLTACLLPDTVGTSEFDKTVERLQTLRNDYETRLAYWQKNLPESSTKDELVKNATKPALKFFDVVESEFIPALKNGDKEAATTILESKLPTLFAQHRRAVDQIVEDTTKNASETEAAVAGIVSSRTWALLATGCLLLVVPTILALWLRQSVARQDAIAVENSAKFAAIDKTQAVIEFNMDGTIVTANENFQKALGYTLNEIVGQHHSMFVDEAMRTSPEYREFWTRLNRGENMPGEFRRIGKGGKVVVIQASYNPIADASGKYVKVVKYANDITAMAASREEAARVNSMMNQAPINVMFADRDFIIRYANPSTIKTLKTLEHLLPIKAESLIGQSIDIFHKRPEHQRHVLSKPENFPMTSEIQLGPETLELTISAVFDHNKNFIGTMASWSVITESKRLAREIKEAAERDQHKAEEMSMILAQINANATTLSSSSEELSAVSAQMALNADETAAQANVVSAASEQVSMNVQTVSTGVEEMNSAIREIAKSASDSARVAQKAVADAQAANSTISKLGDSSAEIGKVIKVITSIAEQTNLLALNATIEAARAGEAGKGFAVVANEVKELAKETARATEDISRKIEAIQGDTEGAVQSIRDIGAVILQISDISNTIASAVEEQTATAAEMSRNVSEAAKGTAEIAQNITSVAQAAQNTTQGAANCQQASAELSRMAMELQQLGASVDGGQATEAGALQSLQAINATSRSATNPPRSARNGSFVPVGKA